MMMKTNSTSIMFVNFMAGGALKKHSALRHEIEDASAVRSLEKDAFISQEVIQDLMLSPYLDARPIMKINANDMQLHRKIQAQRQQCDKTLRHIARLQKKIKSVCQAINMDPANDEDIIRLNGFQKTIEKQLMTLKRDEAALKYKETIFNTNIERHRLDANTLRERHFDTMFSEIERILDISITPAQRETFKGIKSIRQAFQWFQKHQVKPPMTATQAMKDPKAYWVLMFHLIAQGVCYG